MQFTFNRPFSIFRLRLKTFSMPKIKKVVILNQPLNRCMLSCNIIFPVYIITVLLHQRYMINPFLLLGMFTLPFNMVANTPIECTLDRHHPTFNVSLLNSRAVVSCSQNFATFTCKHITLMKSIVV